MHGLGVEDISKAELCIARNKLEAQVKRDGQCLGNRQHRAAGVHVGLPVESHGECGVRSADESA